MYIKEFAMNNITKPTLVILAAGMGSRYGGLKQVDPVGPNGETIMDYSIFDAIRAGFNRVVFVIRKDFEEIFREKIGSKYKGIIEVDYAFQDSEDLPKGFTLPANREKPWGTAHAIRAARSIINTSFVAINADDFYGQDSFVQIASFFTKPETSQDKLHFAMVGYNLNLTLSKNGSVARGVCHTTPQGMLTKVTEMTKIVPTPEGAENQEDPTSPVKLTGHERVSMNFWGFTPELFDCLEEQFSKWLQKNKGNLTAECFIPFVVDELIQEGKAEVTVLPTESSWFGVTYKEDKPVVEEKIRKLINAGVYPAKLFN